MTDDAPAIGGISTTTTEPMELEVTAEALPFEGSAKLQLLGAEGHPERGISTTAWLPPAAARELGEELIGAAAEIEEAAPRSEAAADD